VILYWTSMIAEHPSGAILLFVFRVRIFTKYNARDASVHGPVVELCMIIIPFKLCSNLFS
jgi:hypothetical protein